MLTGRLPFESDDPLELVHHHVAKQPPSPDALASEVPHVLSNIVLKLLSKPAEARYQSGFGLIRDLERCLQDLETTGSIRSFDLGRYDVPARFELPQKLYGREKEINSLAKAMEVTAGGKARTVFLSGCAGAGKTTLAQALCWHVLSGVDSSSPAATKKARGAPLITVFLKHFET